MHRHLALAAASILSHSPAFAATTMPTPLAIDLTAAAPIARQAPFTLGASRNPAGSTITVDNVGLLRDGHAWLPAMGEVHYSRLPRAEWRAELLKMKAGGIDVISTYVFWIHHEEIENAFDFTGDRDLRAFLETCRDVGLPVVVRLGPWCHGEVRNGGFPDWLLAGHGKLRTDDPVYLAVVDRWYRAIAAQAAGLLWKDGGPVVGVQIENEFRGPGDHLMTLKKLAIAAGLDVPLYTRTGWPALTKPIAFGELLPLHGAYAEGFWDRTTATMPGKYWEAFRFETGPTDVGIATDHFGENGGQAGEHRYPFLTCECGGGMMSSYHRRIGVDPRDAAAVALVKLGSGSNLPGYYMYHGGTNPMGVRSTLQERQRTTFTNHNDLPERNYDFQAPLGQYGQVRESYRRLRRLHQFCRDFGPTLADLPVTLPDLGRPKAIGDVDATRWSVRSDGTRGFVFVNNYQRLAAMPPREGVTFALALHDGNSLTMPATPIDVPAGATAIWPFNLPLADGLTLRYATAQPLCALRGRDGDCIVFAQVDGCRANFAFGADVTDAHGKTGSRFDDVAPGRDVAFTYRGKDGRATRVILLGDADSLNAVKLGERLAISDATLYADGSTVRSIGIADADVIDADGRRRTIAPKSVVALTTSVELAIAPDRPAGAARQIESSKTRTAIAPEPADFAGAAVHRVALPATIPDGAFVKLHYVGDVMRVFLGDEMIVDDFYNGDAMEIGLDRYRAALKTHRELRVEILPMPANAPIGFSSPAEVAPAAGVAPVLTSATMASPGSAQWSLSEEELK